MNTFFILSSALKSRKDFFKEISEVKKRLELTSTNSLLAILYNFFYYSCPMSIKENGKELKNKFLFILLISHYFLLCAVSEFRSFLGGTKHMV